MTRQFKTPVAPPALSADPSGGIAGAMYYNTTSGALKVYNGSEWSLISGGGSASSIQVLGDSPASPVQGTVYFNSSENTIKAYNGTIWYDVSGPKELLDHQHYAGEGFVKYAEYGGYVDLGDNIMTMDGGIASSNYSTAPNNDIIDGGNA